jgi:succinate dehydrogenase/fumarate reductase flavoprotein subunit
VPHIDWLPAEIRRDDYGFILTGSDSERGTAISTTRPRPPFPLETSLPGVFAAGDVRHDSVKRVASAVGEGSIAGTQMYQYLQGQLPSPYIEVFEPMLSDAEIASMNNDELIAPSGRHVDPTPAYVGEQEPPRS